VAIVDVFLSKVKRTGAMGNAGMSETAGTGNGRQETADSRQQTGNSRQEKLRN